MFAKFSHSKILLTAAGFCVVAVLGSVLLMSQRTQRQEVLSAATESATVPALGRNAIDVGDVQPGSMVELNAAELLQPGYIVVTQDDNRSVGEILGKTVLLQPGLYQQLQVGVSVPVIDSQVIHIVMYADDGDGLFTEADQPVADANGLPIEVVKNVGMLPMDHAF
jgi:hypothetical protein